MQDKRVSMKDPFSFEHRKAAKILQADIPLTARPFKEIADACNLSGEDLLGWINELSQKGIIRKFGAVLRHQKAGYRKNALILWAADPDTLERAGVAFALLSQVSHCYERKPAFQEKYNLFTMVHSQTDDISSLAETMSRLTGISDYCILESLQEYKKSSPEYF
jgi:siroheme decarboxylase